MKTFERYYLSEKETWEEIKNPFYDFQNDEKISEKVLKDFGINPKKGHIICGHRLLTNPRNFFWGLNK